MGTWNIKYCFWNICSLQEEEIVVYEYVIWKGLKIILGRERAGITIFWYLRGEGGIKTLDIILGDQKKGLRERGVELLEIEIWNYLVGEEIKDLGIIIRVSEKGRGLKKGVIRKGEGIIMREC